MKESDLEKYRGFVDRWFAAADTGNLQDVEDLFHSGLVLHFPGNAGDIEGLGSLSELTRKYHELYPDMKHTILDAFFGQEKLGVRYVVSYTHGGKKIDETGILIVRVVEQKLAEVWVEYDSLGVAKATGEVTPTPAE